MRIFLKILILTFFTTLNSKADIAMRISILSEKLYDDCKIFMQNEYGREFSDMEVVEIVKVFNCKAYILGWLDGTRDQFVLDNFIVSEKASIDIYPEYGCVEKKSFNNANYDKLDIITIAKVFMDYLDENPEARGVEASMGLTYALLTKYPCH